MYLTGFADEAAPGIDGQIQATKELGWHNIESRNIDGKNIHNIPDDVFDTVAGKLEDAGVRINCFGSEIANWGKKITDPFDLTVEQVQRAIPRMQRLGTKLVRIMSYGIMQDRPADDQMAEERFRRLREIKKMFDDAGLTPVHENCMNYGGMGWKYTLELIENVPGLKLVFDTANPLCTPDYAGGDLKKLQSTWDFYDHVRDHIVYVHIKDCRFLEFTEGLFNKAEFTWAGEGDGDVEKIVRDLIARGYDGGISMEPHLSVVFHEEDGAETEADARLRTYVEYGQRFEKLLAACGGDPAAAR